VKSLTNVKLCKDLGVNDLGERFVNQRKQVLVFLCKAIELTIVYTEAQAAVRLGDKEHRRGEERAAKYNKTFVKVF
jgi:translation initiation factor 2 beta subunit (eIF-2beta)/eIF-5